MYVPTDDNANQRLVVEAVLIALAVLIAPAVVAAITDLLLLFITPTTDDAAGQ